VSARPLNKNEHREGKQVITQQQVRISSRTIAASLVLGAALAVGGVTGYAVRGLAQPQDPVPARPATQTGDPATSNTNGYATPQRCPSSLGREDYETCRAQFGENPGSGTAPLDGPSLPPDFFQ
jgi:hypothetical protein